MEREGVCGSNGAALGMFIVVYYLVIFLMWTIVWLRKDAAALYDEVEYFDASSDEEELDEEVIEIPKARKPMKH